MSGTTRAQEHTGTEPLRAPPLEKGKGKHGDARTDPENH
jgi:hypothetical protein